MAAKKKKTTEKGMELKSKIKFHTTKSPQYRTIHADGAITGFGLGSCLDISLFSFHPTLPLDVTHIRDVNGQVGNEIAQTTQGGFAREIECSVILNMDAAEVLATTMLRQIKQRRKEMSKAAKK